MASSTIAEQKKSARRMAHARRDAISAQAREIAAKRVAATLLRHLPGVSERTIAGYWPIGSELDSRPALTALRGAGARLCLPAVVKKDTPLEMRVWDRRAPLFAETYGAMAPPKSAEIVLPEIVLVPLLAFDRAGTRLGYGGGYFDRTVASWTHRPVLVGVGFACQEIADLAREAHDLVLDMVVTEDGVTRMTAGLA